MNFSICKKKLFLFFLLNSLSVYGQTPEIQQPHDDQLSSTLEQQNTALEVYLKNILAQFNSVDMILEDLGVIVNNDQIQKIKNKKQVIANIKNIRSIIASIRNDAFINVNPANLYFLVKVLDHMVCHVSMAIAAGFTQLPPFDLDSKVTRIIQQEVDFNQFDTDLEAVNLKIEALDNQAKSAGLLWYNKIYRKIDDYVIQPCVKHRLIQRSGKVLLGASILFYFFWFHTERGTRPEHELHSRDLAVPIAQDEQLAMLNHMSNQIDTTNRLIHTIGTSHGAIKNSMDAFSSMDMKRAAELSSDDAQLIGHLALPTTVPAPKKYFDFEYKLRDFFGPYPHYIGAASSLNTAFHVPGGKNQLKFLGLLADKIITYNHGQMALGGLLLSLAPSMLNSEIAQAKEWVAKKITALHYKLKGGVYRKQAEETEHKKEPRVTFEDLIGLDHAKEILSFIVRYIEDPERWVRGGLDAHKGYLLTGPTRTGKSFIAEALAGEIKRAMKDKNKNPDEFNFYVIKAAAINQLGIGEVLRLAKNEAPCVIFIDEIDLLSLQRAGGNTTLLNDFLTSLSGCLESTDPKKQVIILAATNKPENLDAALKQPGRFGKEIRFEYPSCHHRKQFLENKLNKLAVNMHEFDLNKIARQTEGCSFEDLNTVVNCAFQQSKIKGHSINQEKLEQALDTEIRNIIMADQKLLPAHERKILAAHQAGHALAATMLCSNQKVAKVTIRPVQNRLKEESVWMPFYEADDNLKQKPIEYGKLFTYCDHDTLHFNSYDEKLQHMKVHLAGHVAEELLLGGSSYCYHQDDKQYALNIAKSLAFEGLQAQKIPKKMQNKLFDKAFDLVNTCKTEVTTLLTNNKEKLKALGNELESKLTLNGDEIEAIIKK